MLLYRHPEISDEKLREMFYGRFGAPAVQEQPASMGPKIDEKTTGVSATTKVSLKTTLSH